MSKVEEEIKTIFDVWDERDNAKYDKITESKLDRDLLRQKMAEVFVGKTPNLYMIKERTSTDEDKTVCKEIIAEYKRVKRQLWLTACQRLSIETMATIISELEDGEDDNSYNDVNAGVISEFLKTI